MARTKKTHTTPGSMPAADAPAAGAPAAGASPAGRPLTNTTAPPPPRKPAPGPKRCLDMETCFNEDDSGDESPRPAKFARFPDESMPVLNLNAVPFSPTAGAAPKTPATPGGEDDMQQDAKAPDALTQPSPVTSATMHVSDATYPEATAADAAEDLMQPDSDPKGKQRSYPMHSEPEDTEPDCSQACRLMPKNYKKKPPMHSGSVYNASELARRSSTHVARNQSPPNLFTTPDKGAAELVRRNSTYVARNQSPPNLCTTPDRGAAEIENLVHKETPKRTGMSSDSEN